jgi:hypothetical protein
MITNDDDWIDLFELAIGWGNENGFIYFQLFEPADNIRVQTILYRQIVRRLGYDISKIKDYRTSGDPTERVLYTTIPSRTFNIKRNTIYAVYDDLIYDIREDEEENVPNENIPNDDPM